MPSVNHGNQYLRLVRELEGVLDDVVPLYGSRFSRKDYTLHQHVILLVLRSRERKPYRDFVQWLEVSDAIRQVLGLTKIPHYTTLQKVADRLAPGVLERVMSCVGRLIVESGYVAGVDGTGFSLERGSRYYCARIKRLSKRRNFLKATIAADTESQALVAARLRLKRRHDSVDFQSTLRKIRDTEPSVIVADKGYDSEDNLVFVERELRAKAVIPLHDRGRSPEKTTGIYRRKLHRDFPREVYHQRSKIETVISVVKRCYGDAIHSRRHRTKKNELYFRLIAYNLRRLTVLLETLIGGFLQSPKFVINISKYAINSGMIKICHLNHRLLYCIKNKRRFRN